jgi:hypothetical protein
MYRAARQGTVLAETAPLAYEQGSAEFEVWLCHRDGSV